MQLVPGMKRGGLLPANCAQKERPASLEIGGQGRNWGSRGRFAPPGSQGLLRSLFLRGVGIGLGLGRRGSGVPRWALDANNLLRTETVEEG